jgi:hypothetical protein
VEAVVPMDEAMQAVAGHSLVLLRLLPESTGRLLSLAMSARRRRDLELRANNRIPSE